MKYTKNICDILYRNIDIIMGEVKRMNYNKAAGILFILIGLIMVGYAVYNNYELNSKLKSYTETEATIIDVERTLKGTTKKHMEYTVVYEYSCDGIRYTVKSGFYKKGMKVGQTVKCYFDPKNPAAGFAEGDIKGSVFLLIGGIVFSLAGAGIMFLPSGNKQTGTDITM